MKKNLHSFTIFTYFFLRVIAGFGQYKTNELIINDPRFNWYRDPISLSEATVVVKPQDGFIIYDYYLTYDIKSTRYGNYDTLEVEHYFQLPKEASIIDSWLWVDTFIMKADLLDRHVAFNIYEGIVKRRQDPSLLYKNNALDYEFRIFPCIVGKTRKVKLSISIPNTYGNGEVTNNCPLNLINNSKIKPKINFILYDKYTKDKLTLKTEELLKGSLDTYDTYKNFSINPPYDNLTFNINKKIDETVLVAEHEGEKYFHLRFDIDKIFNIPYTPQEYIFVVDHTVGPYQFKNIKDDLIKYIDENLKDNDKIQIIYNNITTKQIYNDLKTKKESEYNQFITGLDLGITSLLSSSLDQAYKVAQSYPKANVIVMSSDYSYRDAFACQKLKDHLFKEFKLRPRTIFIDYSFNSSWFWYQNVNYRGNELLYKIISSNTNGSYFTTNAGSVESNLASAHQFLNKEANVFKSIYLKPKNGLVYDLVDLEKNKYNKIGKFKGQLPFYADLNLVIGDSIYVKELYFERSENVENIKEFVQYYYGYKLRAQEQVYYSNNSLRDEVIAISKKHRILSLNTAFLALEPGLQEPCFDCLDEDISIVNTEDESDAPIKLIASPNPFANYLELKIEGIENENEISSIQLYDLNGKLVYTKFTTTAEDGNVVIRFETEELSNGMYILKVVISGKVYTFKVVKI